MPRNRSLVVLVGLLGACRSQSAEGDAAAGDGAPALASRGACDHDELSSLATALAAADARAQRELVATKLGEACTLPSALATYLALGQGALAIPTAEERGAVLRAVCPGAEDVMEHAAKASARGRGHLIFDACKLARFDLIDAEEFAQVAESTVFPFYALSWLHEQQVDPQVARTVARAVVLLDRYDLRAADQTLVQAPQPLPPVPHGVLVQVTRKEIRADDRTLLKLDAHGKVPPEAMKSHVIGPLFELLSEEKETSTAIADGAAPRMILVADENMPFSMLVDILYTAGRAGVPRYALVAELARLRFGGIEVDDWRAGADAAPVLGVRIDDAGFAVYAHDAPDARIDGPASGPAWDYAALAASAAAFKAAYPDATQARVAATPEMPYSVVLSALAAVRGPGCGAAGTCVLPQAFVADSAKRVVDGIPTMSANFDPDVEARRPGIFGDRSADGVDDEGSVFDLIAKDDNVHWPKGGVTLDLAKVVVNGSVRDENIIRHTVRSSLGGVRTCYDAALGRDATLAGTLTVSFQIGDDGTVDHASIVEPTLGDEALGTCIVEAIEGWRFPRPKAGVVEVSAPIGLTP